MYYSATSDIVRAYKMTLMEKVWIAAKKYPGRTAKELAELIPDVQYGSVSSYLSAMDSRGMVYVSGKKGGRRTYSTDLEKYEVLPAPEKKVDVRYIPVQNEAQETFNCVPEGVVVQEPVQKPSLPINLDELTVGQAKQLYAQLRGLQEMFA